MRGRELVTVDLGNSACKARRWRGRRGELPAIVDGFEAATARGVGSEIARWIDGIPRDAHAAFACVAAVELEDELAQALSSYFGEHFHRRLDPGLENEYRTPESLGCDRVFAARGAVEKLGESCIVVDAGTALTVDAVKVGVRGRATFLGGAIAPGPALLARTLGWGAARLYRVEAAPRARALGRDTREALQAGVSVGFRGMARELVVGVSRDAKLVRAPIALTGGARGLLLDPPFITRRTLCEIEDLVHVGLCAALRDLER